MGNSTTRNEIITIDGKISLSPLMTEIRAADEELFNELLPYYNREKYHIMIFIYVYKNNDAIIITDKKNMKIGEKCYSTSFIFERKESVKVAAAHICRSKFGYDVDEFKPAYCTTNCPVYAYMKFEQNAHKMKFSFLDLLFKHKDIAECLHLFKLLCFTMGLDHKKCLQDENRANVDETNVNKTNTQSTIDKSTIDKPTIDKPTIDKSTEYEPSAPDVPN